MKVSLLSHSDGRGGAFASAYRLHKALQKNGVISTMVVGEKTRDDYSVLSPATKLARACSTLAPKLDRLALSLYPQPDGPFYSVQWVPDRVTYRIAAIDPDIVNLHWICAGFLRIETVAEFDRPIVWTLHDSWAFTGGCHVPFDCDRYTRSCGSCPQLRSDRQRDVSRWVWRRKAKAWKSIDITLVTPSAWLAERARASSLFRSARIEVIANGLDIQRYKPIDKSLARDLLGLPQDLKLILCGAIDFTSDRNKGFHLLLPALKMLCRSTWGKRTELVVFGASRPMDPPDFGLKAHYMGRLNDDVSLSLLYAAADVFVAPSLQENLPNTVMESLACGTPCVAFRIGGVPELIEHCENGYLAKPFELADLAAGMAWVLEHGERYPGVLSQRARAKVEGEFTLDLQARRYLSLFEELLHPSRQRGGTRSCA